MICADKCSMSYAGRRSFSHICFGAITETVEAILSERLRTLFRNFLSIVRKTSSPAFSAVHRWKASANCASPKVFRRWINRGCVIQPRKSSCLRFCRSGMKVATSLSQIEIASSERVASRNSLMKSKFGPAAFLINANRSTGQGTFVISTPANQSIPKYPCFDPGCLRASSSNSGDVQNSNSPSFAAAHRDTKYGSCSRRNSSSSLG